MAAFGLVVNVRCLHVPVFKPFLKLAVAADLIRRKPVTRCGNLFAEVFVHSKNFRCADAIAEQVAQDLHVHRRPGANRRAERMHVFG